VTYDDSENQAKIKIFFGKSGKIFDVYLFNLALMLPPKIFGVFLFDLSGINVVPFFLI